MGYAFDEAFAADAIPTFRSGRETISFSKGSTRKPEVLFEKIRAEGGFTQSGEIQGVALFARADENHAVLINDGGIKSEYFPWEHVIAVP